jgi:tetratricopeptide (TPR) repeat protein
MSDFFFISYSSVDGKDFALMLSKKLAAGIPPIPVWLDKSSLRPGEDWDEQVAEAIKTCKGMIFVMSFDSVCKDSICKNEWVWALRYKKPIIPLRKDHEADLPFRLGSREYIDFCGSINPSIAQLRKHLIWMDSPEGQLQALKYRLSDAKREFPRAELEQQARIQLDINELESQIAQQQKIINNPKAAEQRVKKSITTGLKEECTPSRPVDGIAKIIFINPPPLIAPTWFQDRRVETQQIGDFLKDESLRLLTIVGRGGVGKSAMVCRLLRALEGGKLPDDGGSLNVDGIVYLSASRPFQRPNLPDLYSGLVKLLPDQIVKELDYICKHPQSTTRTTMEALVQAFPRGRTVVLLDDFEVMIDIETGKIKDVDLDVALRLLLELPPHGLKFIITTRFAPGDLAMVQPALQRRLDLDAGLDHPYAEIVLRSMDTDGKVGLRDAPEELLGKARERTRGYPRALVHLFGILSADRDTSLQELLDNTQKYLPEQIVTVLVGEAFSRLDLTAQRVMQALAVYHYPVSSAALDYLLQFQIPGINSRQVLSRLVNMQFVRHDKGRYYLHQVDRDYALSRIAEGDPADRDKESPPLTRFAMLHRAAAWFKLSRIPQEEWKTLEDLKAQLCEFELRCEGNEFDTAAALLLEFDFDYLFLWGHYRLMTELHERLQGKITNPELEEYSNGNLASAYHRIGQFQKAISFCEKALLISKKRNHLLGIGVWLHNLANYVSDIGQHASAIKYLHQALTIRRKNDNRKGESLDLSSLANLYSEIGNNTLAVKYYKKALLIHHELKRMKGEATDLDNLGNSYRCLGQISEAQKCHKNAFSIASSIGYRLIETSSNTSFGELYISQNKLPEATRVLKRAIEIADEIGNSQFSKNARENLALVRLYENNLPMARQMINDARKYNVPLRDHYTSAILGVVILRQGDLITARETFNEAIKEANQLISMCADRYEALDVIGLSLSGLALCGDLEQIPSAKNAYRKARAVTTDIGIVQALLKLFDALAQTDAEGILAEVRLVAAGI